MSDDAFTPDNPVSYVVRLRERASRDIDAAYVRFAEVASEIVAEEWREGLLDALADLTTMPRRFPPVSERFRREVRQMLYRRSGSQVAYRVLFTFIGEQAQSLDPPTIVVLHVRHASAKAITRAEIRELEAEL